MAASRRVLAFGLVGLLVVAGLAAALETCGQPGCVGWTASLNTNGEFDSYKNVVVGPDRDVVFALGSTIDWNTLGGDLTLQSLHPVTGQILWSRGGFGRGPEREEVIATDDLRVYVAYMEPNQRWAARAYYATNGTLAWTSAVSAGSPEATYTIGGDIVVLLQNGTSVEVARLKGSSGTLEWRASYSGLVVRSKAFADDQVYVGGTRSTVPGTSDHLLVAFDANAGNKTWERTLVAAGSFAEPKIGAAAGVVVAWDLSRSPPVVALSDSGAVLWEKSGITPGLGVDVSEHGVVLSSAFGVHHLGLDGAVKWVLAFPGETDSVGASLTGDGKVLITTINTFSLWDDGVRLYERSKSYSPGVPHPARSGLAFGLSSTTLGNGGDARAEALHIQNKASAPAAQGNAGPDIGEVTIEWSVPTYLGLSDPVGMRTRYDGNTTIHAFENASIVIRDLAPGQSVSVRVAAVTGVGGGNETIVNVTAWDVPGTPATPRARPGPEPWSVEVTWQLISEQTLPVTSYLVERSTDGENFEEAGRAAGSETRFIDRDVGPGIFHYRVRGENLVGAGEPAQVPCKIGVATLPVGNPVSIYLPC